MIQKYFEKMLIKTFNRFNEQLGQYLVMNTEIIKEHNKDLEAIKKSLYRQDGLTTGYTTSVCGSYNTTEELNSIFDDTLKKDYFTQEFINKDATNTKELYIVEIDTIKKVLYSFAILKMGNIFKCSFLPITPHNPGPPDSF